MDFNIGEFLDVQAVPVFDAARSSVLTTPLPPVRDFQQTATSSTGSRFRLRWNKLLQWRTFEDDVMTYFSTVVTPADLTAHVANLDGMRTLWFAVNGEEIRAEADIKHCIMTYKTPWMVTPRQIDEVIDESPNLYLVAHD